MTEFEEFYRFEIYSNKESDLCGVKPMTLITAMKAKNSIIMASDSRALIGLSGYRDNQIKLYIINNFVLGIVGEGEIGLFLMRAHKKTLINDNLPIDLLAKDIAVKFSESYGKWFSKTPIEKRPVVNFILAGYATEEMPNNAATIYLFDCKKEFCPGLAGAYPIFGGFSQYASYLCSKYYDPNISKEKALILSAYLITETASQEVFVGGKVHIIEIPPTKGPVELEDAEINKIILANNSFNANIQDAFNKLNTSSIAQT
jgi:20S proteasome alpha/beta subunit